MDDEQADWISVCNVLGSFLRAVMKVAISVGGLCVSKEMKTIEVSDAYRAIQEEL